MFLQNPESDPKRLTREGNSSPTETDPLLPSSHQTHGRDEELPTQWKAPPYFLWIELAIFSNVFLAGFDGTVTASTYASISSEFRASEMASWITTAYLLTSTAMQPLYGRFSDIFGRRICLIFATVCFATGCIGCAAATDMVFLALMRGLTGIGGGGLMTMATIINSDLVDGRHRGMYQAAQNVLHGLGAISGASMGGLITDLVGWRFCFLLQVPISAMALLVGSKFVPDQTVSPAISPSGLETGSKDLVVSENMSKWKQIDLSGAVLLVAGLSLQLASLSMGGVELPWSHPVIIISLCTAGVILGLFFYVEKTTDAIPIMPMRLLLNPKTVGTLIANILLGLGAYGSLFIMPLFFQSVLLDSPSRAGLRLVAPALATPLGGLVTGLAMTRSATCLPILTRVGLGSVLVSSVLLLSLGPSEPEWKYSAFMIPGNFGQGMAYPAILFSFIRGSSPKDHAVATSLVYLTRSMGTVWGVAAVSTITQAALKVRLEAILPDSAGKLGLIEEIRHSVEALHQLPPALRELSQLAYYESVRSSLFFLLAVAALAFGASFCSGATNGVSETADDDH